MSIPNDAGLASPTPTRGVAFVVHGTPAPQGSAKAFVVGKRAVVTHDNKQTQPWRAAVTAVAKAAHAGAEPINTPVSVALTVYVQKPRATKFRAYPAGSPDLDKYQRAVGDALEQAGVLTNDARIVHWDPWKRWATEDNPPGALITITELEES